MISEKVDQIISNAIIITTNENGCIEYDWSNLASIMSQYPDKISTIFHKINDKWIKNIIKDYIERVDIESVSMIIKIYDEEDDNYNIFLYNCIFNIIYEEYYKKEPDHIYNHKKRVELIKTILNHIDYKQRINQPYIMNGNIDHIIGQIYGFETSKKYHAQYFTLLDFAILCKSERAMRVLMEVGADVDSLRLETKNIICKMFLTNK